MKGKHISKLSAVLRSKLYGWKRAKHVYNFCNSCDKCSKAMFNLEHERKLYIHCATMVMHIKIKQNMLNAAV